MRIVNALGVLLAINLLTLLLAPALLADRESSRRGSCARNLSFIGQALQKHNEARNVLPAVAVGDPLGNWIPREVGQDITAPDAINWVVLLLPYLDEEGMQSKVAFRKEDPFNTTRFQSQFSLFSCPSDTYNRSDNRYLGDYSRGNYAINAGPNDICLWPGTREHICPNGASLKIHKSTRKLEWVGDGVAGYNKQLRLEAFSNGLSQMVSVDEIRAGIDEFDSRGVWALGMAGASVTHQHGLYGDDGSPNNSSPNADDVLGCEQTVKRWGRKRMVLERMQCATHIPRPRQATARSLHPGGVHCLTLDGSCHFVSNDVSVDVWHAMHSRQHPDVIELPWE